MGAGCCPQPSLLYSPSRVCVPSPSPDPQGILGLWFLSGLTLVGLIYERSPHLTLSPGPPPSPPLLPPTPPLPDCPLSFPQSQDFPGAGGSKPRTTPDQFPHLSYPSHSSPTLSPPLWPSSVKSKGWRERSKASLIPKEGPEVRSHPSGVKRVPSHSLRNSC